jgi:dienelactone hydrolase
MSATAEDVAVIDNVGVKTTFVVTQTDLTSPVVGTLYVPDHLPAHVPAVLFLGGSEGFGADNYVGGLSDLARHLASQGFVTLDLCYFDCPQRSQYLNRIPLEYVQSAVRYLAGLSDVDADNVNIFGWSRGGELALLVGAYDHDVRSVVSVYGAPWVFWRPVWTRTGCQGDRRLRMDAER